MYKTFLVMIIGALFCICANSAHGDHSAVDYRYMAINRHELIRDIRNPHTTETYHWILINRAKTSGILEDAISEYDHQHTLNPNNPVLAAAFGHAFFTAHWGGYKPINTQQWKTQYVTLYNQARYALEDSVKGKGSSSWFCWLALGQFHVTTFMSVSLNEGRSELHTSYLLNKQSPFAHEWLSFSFLVMDAAYNPAKSLAEAQLAIKLCPDSAFAYDQESGAYVALKNYNAAYAAEKKSLSLLPSSYHVRPDTVQWLASLKHLATTTK